MAIKDKKIDGIGQVDKPMPDAKIKEKAMPTTKRKTKALPNTEQQTKELPDTEQTVKELPKVGSPENTVMIGGELIEIKPTKLKYQRNRTAAFYKLLEMYPLTDILAMSAGTFGDDRDGDKAIMDWLIAATDNEELILANYDEMDTGTIEKILSIFRRVNRIDEKEEKLKNMERERKGAV